MSTAEKVAAYWSTDHKIDRPLSWLEHPAIMRYVNRRVTGDPNLHFVEWFQQAYLPTQVDLALSLGCGLGGFERSACQLRIAQKIDANDISSGAIVTAKAEAEKAGLGDRINYSIVNLDEAGFPEAAYDVVFGNSCVHHVFQLEGLFKRVRKSMKPGALFYLNEYVGPTRFQTSPALTVLINNIRRAFPDVLLRSLFASDGSLIGRYTPSPVEHFEAHDPSEAIRSAEIVPLLKMYFEILEYRPFGGAILHMLLSGIAGNFEESDPKDRALLDVLAIMEESLEDAGAIESDFAVIVARAK